MKKARDSSSDMSREDRKKYLEMYEKKKERERKRAAQKSEMIKKARDE